MKNYLLINNGLNGTGGARVILNLASYLLDANCKVSILIDRCDNIDFSIDDRLDVYLRNKVGISKLDLSEKTKSLKNVKNRKVWLPYTLKLLIKKAKNFISFFSFFKEKKIFNDFVESSKFDVVVSNNIYNNLHRILFEKKLCKNYFVNFHNSPREVFSRLDFSTFLPLGVIFKKVKILTVSDDIKKELINFGPFKQNNITTIYNPFNFQWVQGLALNKSPISIPGDYIITVSTLSKRKRVERAIYAFKEILKYYPNMNLVILGDGDLRSELQKIVSSLNIVDSVHFLGFQSNPYVYINNAKLLVLTSDSEGLPTVIIESLILGTPVVSTDCPTGPREILFPWSDESLVDIAESVTETKIVNSLTQKIKFIIDAKYSKELVINKSQLGRFKDDVIIKKWLSL